MKIEEALKVRRDCAAEEAALRAQLSGLKARRIEAEGVIAGYLSPFQIGQVIEGLAGRHKGVKFEVARCELSWLKSEEPLSGSCYIYARKLKKDGTPGQGETCIHFPEEYRAV